MIEAKEKDGRGVLLKFELEASAFQASWLLMLLAGEVQFAQGPAAEVVFLAMKRIALRLADYADRLGTSVVEATNPAQPLPPPRSRPPDAAAYRRGLEAARVVAASEQLNWRHSNPAWAACASICDRIRALPIEEEEVADG